ncbi:hypothetical protein QYF61_024373 [Mycteria americana]|uniref:Uncharacterized protein n=1 Tax=Mycteria americana TaxID=33587 RepID=A0AAN7PKY4_MYCAM|nr:hypothetical protein QYF61_024373 [Mycteria americana]
MSSPVKKQGECGSPQNTNKDGISGQIRGQHLQGYSLPLQRCGQQQGNTFSTVRVTEHWHRLPREVVESLPLEILRSLLDTGNQLYVALLRLAPWPPCTPSPDKPSIAPDAVSFLCQSSACGGCAAGAGQVFAQREAPQEHAWREEQGELVCLDMSAVVAKSTLGATRKSSSACYSYRQLQSVTGAAAAEHTLPATAHLLVHVSITDLADQQLLVVQWWQDAKGQAHVQYPLLRNRQSWADRRVQLGHGATLQISSSLRLTSSCNAEINDPSLSTVPHLQCYFNILRMLKALLSSDRTASVPVSDGKGLSAQ